MSTIGIKYFYEFVIWHDDFKKIIGTNFFSWGVEIFNFWGVSGAPPKTTTDKKSFFILKSDIKLIVMSL